eukprot:scaffold218350_cov17-Tisochrysis_lutea.AAC.1
MEEGGAQWSAEGLNRITGTHSHLQHGSPMNGQICSGGLPGLPTVRVARMCKPPEQNLTPIAGVACICKPPEQILTPNTGVAGHDPIHVTWSRNPGAGCGNAKETASYTDSRENAEGTAFYPQSQGDSNLPKIKERQRDSKPLTLRAGQLAASAD